MTFKYDFAISFAGEVREIAKKIANLLRKRNVRVFYDRFFEARMLGKKLTNYFQETFGADAKYVIILISKEYPAKDWTNFEFSIARDEARKREEEFILPIRLDDTKVVGLHDDICFIDLQEKSVEEAVDILLEKLGVEGIDETIDETLDDKYVKDKAKELLVDVNKTDIKLSEFLAEYYDFLIKTGEKEEIKWVEAELSGTLYEVGKDNPEYFKYRGIKGYISPVRVSIPNLIYSSFEMIINEPKFHMRPFNFIPPISVYEFEKYKDDLDKIGIITLSEDTIKLLISDATDKLKLYFYFKGSDIAHIISNIKQKIGRFLINKINN